jgi:phytoene desaturase
MRKAIVVGSGIAGIAVAIRLAIKGYEVNVFEKNSYPGGKLCSINENGYRFDAGPSLFTLPKQVDELFELAGEDPRNHFNYKRLPIICNYFWDEGLFLSAKSDELEFASDIEKLIGVKKSLVLKYLKKSRFIYDTTAPVFLHQSLHKLKNFLDFKTLNGILKIPFLGIFSTLNEVNSKQLNHPKLVQLFNRYATYNGSNPYRAPGVLQSIPHLEFGEGAWFPEGGMVSITNSLVALAKRKGVTFNFDSCVDQFIIENKIIDGIQFKGEKYSADIVVCNSDILPAYRNLMPHEKAPERILSQNRSSSALIFYWGINNVIGKLDVHNIFFSNNYEDEFSQIEKGNSISTDPTVYVHISSIMEPSDAPEDCQNWFVMINVPENKDQNWDELIIEARKNILKKLNFNLKMDLEKYIVSESILDPRTIEKRTSSAGGSLYGNSSNNKKAAFLRHPNFSSNVQGLYFCGGSVHPGGGIPLCLQSAKIVSDLIRKA